VFLKAIYAAALATVERVMCVHYAVKLRIRAIHKTIMY